MASRSRRQFRPVLDADDLRPSWSSEQRSFYQPSVEASPPSVFDVDATGRPRGDCPAVTERLLKIHRPTACDPSTRSTARMPTRAAARCARHRRPATRCAARAAWCAGCRRCRGCSRIGRQQRRPVTNAAMRDTVGLGLGGHRRTHHRRGRACRRTGSDRGGGGSGRRGCRCLPAGSGEWSRDAPCLGLRRPDSDGLRVAARGTSARMTRCVMFRTPQRRARLAVRHALAPSAAAGQPGVRCGR